MATISIGQEIGKYKIVERLGRGGMAEVYKAYQKNLDRYVAIKLMHTFLLAEKDFLHRFQREAKAMAALNHPHIVGVYDFDVYGEDVYYLVMEYIGGGTLKEKLQELAGEKAQLPLETTVKIITEITAALAYAHSRGMIHRDIKPANIMLDELGKAILTDFGIVKLVGGQSMAYTATGALIGTPAYMSPEQALGQPGDERSDIYSLGVLLFQMTTGKLPFDADTPLAVVMKHVNDPVPLPISFNPDVPPRLQEIILKALAKEAKNRFQTADEMVKALRQADLLSPMPAMADTVLGIPPETVENTIEEKAPVTVVQMPGIEATTVLNDPAAVIPDVSFPPAEEGKKKRSPWVWAGIGLVALLLLGSVWSLVMSRNDDSEAVTPTTAVAEIGAVATQSPVPIETPDIVASSVAAIAQTAAAQPTETVLPSATPTTTATATNTPPATATVTPTPDATMTFMATCEVDVALIEAHPYENNASNTVSTGATFPMFWVLQNSGTCPWPTDLRWVYQEGSQFGYDGEPVELDAVSDVAAGETVTLTVTFRAPIEVAAYESTWQLVDAEDAPFGPEITFAVQTFVPATAVPTATPTLVASPTPEVEVTELNYITVPVADSCIYQGGDWQCHVQITPFGGGGGPYTIFIFDQPAGQATEYRGPFPMNYFPRARRCASFNSEVRVIDDATGQSFSRHLFVNPNSSDYFNGTCTES